MSWTQLPTPFPFWFIITVCSVACRGYVAITSTPRPKHYPGSHMIRIAFTPQKYRIPQDTLAERCSFGALKTRRCFGGVLWAESGWDTRTGGHVFHSRTALITLLKKQWVKQFSCTHTFSHPKEERGRELNLPRPPSLEPLVFLRVPFIQSPPLPNKG